jgi:hypothetical protein
MPAMMMLAALVAAVAAYTAYCSLAALRWREIKRFWLFLGATVPLSILAFALLWFAVQHPRLNLPLTANMGFGPEWDCSPDINGGGVCLRKPPTAMLPAKADAKEP